MEIKEAKELKLKLEVDITDMIIKFMTETGLYIDGVNIYYSKPGIGSTGIIIVACNTKLL